MSTKNMTCEDMSHGKTITGLSGSAGGTDCRGPCGVNPLANGVLVLVGLPECSAY